MIRSQIRGLIGFIVTGIMLFRITPMMWEDHWILGLVCLFISCGLGWYAYDAFANADDPDNDY